MIMRYEVFAGDAWAACSLAPDFDASEYSKNLSTRKEEQYLLPIRRMTGKLFCCSHPALRERRRLSTVRPGRAWCFVNSRDMEIARLSQPKRGPQKPLLPHVLDILKDSLFCNSNFTIDKAYGVLGLLFDHEAPTIEIGYSFDPSEVFHKLLSWSCHEDMDLRFFNCLLGQWKIQTSSVHYGY